MGICGSHPKTTDASSPDGPTASSPGREATTDVREENSTHTPPLTRLYRAFYAKEPEGELSIKGFAEILGISLENQSLFALGSIIDSSGRQQIKFVEFLVVISTFSNRAEPNGAAKFAWQLINWEFKTSVSKVVARLKHRHYLRFHFACSVFGVVI